MTKQNHEEDFIKCCDDFTAILLTTDASTDHGKKVLQVATSILQEAMADCVKHGTSELLVKNILKNSMKKLYK